MKALLLTLILSLSFSCGAQDFAEAIKTALADSQPTDLAVQGSDKNWFFLRKELEHLQQGDLAAADFTKANKEGTDPLPVITKYQEELKALGIELLVVPVPAKAAIYPEKFNDKVDVKTVPSMAGFYAKLKAAGVNVLDLETVFKDDRAKNPGQQLYCATDSHWSPHACQLVAKLIADYCVAPPLSIPKASTDLITLKEEPLEFYGDLLSAAQKATLPKESLPYVRAGISNNNGTQVLTANSEPSSPVLVIGDSHLQIFRKGGNMLATLGGLIDHFQVDLASPVEEITMQAGGADGPRVEIARTTSKNPDYWKNKKVVIWVFTSREFTQGKWRVIPAKVIKK
ncbi:hypothetical protein BH11VER1_BH11VER1_04650 [soil metagenome]